VLVDALSYIWSAAWVGAIRSREPRPERAADRHLGREMKEGLAFVLGHPLLRAITACTATANLFQNVAMTVFVVLLASADELNLSAGTIGLLFSASAVGGLLGALVARRFAGWVGQGPALWISIAVSVPAMLPMPFVQRGWLLALVAATSVFTGVTIVVYNITQVSFRQLLCPERLLGRMNATIRFAVWGTIPIGSLIGGILGATIGLRPTLWVAVAGSALAVLPVFFSPLRTMRELPTEYAPPEVELGTGGPPFAGAVSGPAAGEDGGVAGPSGATSAAAGVAGERGDGAP
jgi:predicted MFS family arabinose efflux permease